ncbi:Berberine/berberine domain-containing protein [Streptomyces bingchenggensis BCW-1]|uniref:Berberine/berberine domain-containing protein n=1 Tax=Streptomyces bingchenggensis (strain BCW-1) TaxID=749414 RepID=D7CB81_STRBB|nr:MULTISPECIES: FAD-binding protein [Streptomyces]ADI10764.1 Berberine/berberine domain-containing protein [Streptomyces bingchenggensis BCW-1]
MSSHDKQARRTVLRAMSAAGAGLALTPSAARAASPEGSAVGSGACASDWLPEGPLRVSPADPRYAHLVARGASNRFRGRPDHVYLVGSTEHVVRTVREAVRSGARLAVRSGGHCFEDFVDNPDVKAVIDMSPMADVSFDERRRAFVVEAGATLGEVYRKLYLGWGVTLPAGYHAEVGAGGHVPGGGYGPLCRLFGVVSDYLYAVEVVVVDHAGEVRAVVATREQDDPNRELWWAHTGGGGGNFGVVTRYWFRSPEATADTDPSRMLPTPTRTALTFTADWSWEGMDEERFTRMVRNHGQWAERHGAADENAALYAEFALTRRAAGAHLLLGQVAAEPGADRRLLDGFLGAVSAGTTRPGNLKVQRLPWLTAALNGSGEAVGDWYIKIKSAFLRRRLTDAQIAAVHRHLTRADTDVVAGSVVLNTYGGAVNALSPADTAMPHRDSVIKLSCLASWAEPDQGPDYLAWIRECYRDLFAATGGVPVPGEAADGAFINYPDTDLADPRWNTSDTPWQTLYYKDNHPRLRAAKARWDPREVFRHALSIRP